MFRQILLCVLLRRRVGPWLFILTRCYSTPSSFFSTATTPKHLLHPHHAEHIASESTQSSSSPQVLSTPTNIHKPCPTSNIIHNTIHKTKQDPLSTKIGNHPLSIHTLQHRIRTRSTKSHQNKPHLSHTLQNQTRPQHKHNACNGHQEAHSS